MSEWDYVIAGGGTAGCVLARRLSERGQVRVLLLEAGGEYPAALSVPLVGMRRSVDFSWRYFTRQQGGLGGRRLSFPFGKVLGGSSAVNAMMFYRGTPGAYDRWEQLGCEGWNFRTMRPYFERVERVLEVSPPRHVAPFSRAFVEACMETGMAPVDDFHAVEEGAGLFAVMQRRGRRVSAATAYLAGARGCVEVVTRALIRRVVIEGSRAVAVEYEDSKGVVQQARAGREILLCAGALNSPKLLMLSGIGGADSLRELDLPVVQDLPGVGRNLQDHVRVPVLFESGRRSPGAMLNWVPAALQYAVARRGVLTSNCCEAGAVVRSTPEATLPDLQFVTHFQSHLYPGVVDLQFCISRTRSRGSVTLASADPKTPPVIDPNYFSDSADVKVALAGVRLARRIAGAPALKRFPLGAEVMPGADLTADGELESYCRAMAETCYHPAGTCKMGSDPMAVVDPEFRVRGIAGLRVVDASVFPELPNGNTCAPVYMVAECAADLIG
jgi:choline dehydrogenase